MQNDIAANSPWVFISDGELNPELAGKTSEIFGFWPIEINTGNETSGFAWRQSNKNPEWTPFDNVQINN